MDASDIIRMRNANAQFCYLKKNVLAKQPTCYSDTCLDLSGCAPIQYNSYAQKYLLKEGAHDMGGYTPPIIPTYNNKLGFYVLGNYDGYDNYQYRFYDGWGPLIDSGIRVSQNYIYGSYYGLGYQYAHFYDRYSGENVTLQILDSTGIIIKTISYQSVSGPANYYNGERYAILYYQTPSGINKFLFIDPLHGTVKKFTTDLTFSGKIGVTGSAVSFILTDCPDCYFYIWPAKSKQPYMALKFFNNSYFPNTPSIMNHVAFATQNSDGYYNKVSVLLADGTFLTYTLPSTYNSIDMSYYGIDNSRLYLIGSSTDVYLFTLNTSDFMNPTKILGVNNVNGFNIIAHINEYKDYLTAQNNHFGMYVYADDYVPYSAPFYNATFIAVFENGTSFSNDYTYDNFAISDYVGLNSNGFTLLGNSNDNSLISYTIASPLIKYTRVLTTATVDTNVDYIIQSANLNDYIYFDIYTSDPSTDTTHRGFIIDSTNNHAPYYQAYANNYRSDITIVSSGNSLCCTGTQDPRLAYFNPTVEFHIDNNTDIYEGTLYATYPWLGSGTIFSLNSDASFNILTSNTYNPNMYNSFNAITNTLNLYGFSDNINILGWNGGGLSVYNLDASGALTVSPPVTVTWWGIYFQNTPTKAMWAVYTSGGTGGLKYVDYDITTKTYAALNETNAITDLVLRTNNYYTTNS